MLIALRILRKSLKILTGDVSSGEIAGGVILGALLGLCPFNFLNLLFLLLLVAVLRVNMGFFFVSWAVFSGVGYLAGPILHLVGKALLIDAAFLRPVWEYASSLPILPLTDFNNTLMMGGFVVWLVSALPLFKLIKVGVEMFRKKLSERLKKGHIGLVLRLAGWLGILGRFEGS